MNHTNFEPRGQEEVKPIDLLDGDLKERFASVLDMFEAKLKSYLIEHGIRVSEMQTVLELSVQTFANSQYEFVVNATVDGDYNAMKTVIVDSLNEAKRVLKSSDLVLSVSVVDKGKKELLDRYPKKNISLTFASQMHASQAPHQDDTEPITKRMREQFGIIMEPPADTPVVLTEDLPSTVPDGKAPQVIRDVDAEALRMAQGMPRGKAPSIPDGEVRINGEYEVPQTITEINTSTIRDPRRESRSRRTTLKEGAVTTAINLDSLGLDDVRKMAMTLALENLLGNFSYLSLITVISNRVVSATLWNSFKFRLLESAQDMKVTKLIGEREINLLLQHLLENKIITWSGEQNEE